MSTPSQIAALLEGNLDVGILRWPVNHPQLTGGSLFRESLVLAAPSAMRFQSSEGLLSVRDKPFILLPRSTSETFHDHTINLCLRSGFTPRVVQEASEIFTILNLVRAGLGVALVPSSAVRMRVPGVRLRRLRTSHASWSIGVAWNRATEKAAMVQRWVEVIRTAVRDKN
jgi:DNA-binding transcriptional LysR family regulator